MVDPLSSGANHEKVAEAHPDWDKYDWCRYWELDARKTCKRFGIPDPGRIMDCGEKCKCKGLK